MNASATNTLARVECALALSEGLDTAEATFEAFGAVLPTLKAEGRRLRHPTCQVRE
jgi:hypothetical protein